MESMEETRFNHDDFTCSILVYGLFKEDRIDDAF